MSRWQSGAYRVLSPIGVFPIFQSSIIPSFQHSILPIFHLFFNVFKKKPHRFCKPGRFRSNLPIFHLSIIPIFQPSSSPLPLSPPPIIHRNKPGSFIIGLALENVIVFGEGIYGLYKIEGKRNAVALFAINPGFDVIAAINSFW